MALADDLKAEVAKILAEQWTTRNGTVVPESDTVRLGNDAVKLDATVLYADLTASTALVDAKHASFAAEVYKAYLHCAAKLIRHFGGVITAYDGDRIMAVYIGGSKNSNAAKTALKINGAVQKVINPALKAQYPSETYVVQQAVGIDTSALWVARTGVRGANDLVWVGRAANYAAKLCSLRTGNHASFITADVYTRLNEESKLSMKDKKPMWEAFAWAEQNLTAYRSSWHWGP